MKKILKTKRRSTPKLCWADKVKFEFGGQKGKMQSHLNITIVFDHFRPNYWSQLHQNLHNWSQHYFLQMLFYIICSIF